MTFIITLQDGLIARHKKRVNDHFSDVTENDQDEEEMFSDVEGLEDDHEENSESDEENQ